jgi:hypothetical protein
MGWLVSYTNQLDMSIFFFCRGDILADSNYETGLNGCRYYMGP